MRENISAPSPPPSGVGDFPGMVTGELRASIRVERELLLRHILSDAPHAMWLEASGRSFLRRTLIEMQDYIRKTLSQPVKIS